MAWSDEGGPFAVGELARDVAPAMVAALFPGQGSHQPGMDAPFRDNEVFLTGLELLGYDPFDLLDEGTRTQQPAIFLCSVAAWHGRSRDGSQYVGAGHSLGEYAALVAAGALSLQDGVALVGERAAAMADAAEANPGSMTAMLGGEPQLIRELAAELGLTIANDNAPGQLVLAGSLEGLERAEACARERTGARARRLDVAGAFHSPLMEPAADRLRAALERVAIREPQFPVISNGTAESFGDIRVELVENMLRPVLWRQTLLALHARGIEEFDEVGPGEVLTGLVRRTLPDTASVRVGA